MNFLRGIFSVSMIDLWIFRSSQKIVNGNTEIICNFDETIIVRFSFAVFITADGILIHIEVKSKL